MRQFVIIAWKGNLPHARDAAGKWQPLPDATKGYDDVAADFHKISPDGIHDEFDSVELHDFSGLRKARKLISQKERDRRHEVQARANADHDKAVHTAKAAAEKKKLEEAEKEAARHRAALDEHEKALAKLKGDAKPAEAAAAVTPAPDKATRRK